MQYYFSHDGNNRQGPVSADQLIPSGVTAATLVWRDGMGDWQPAGRMPELANLFAAPHVPPQPAAPQQYQQQQQGYAPQQQAYAPQQQQPAYSQGYQQPQSANGMAITSLIIGLISVPAICLAGGGILPALLAVIFGHVAKSQIRAGRGGGDGMALAGLIIGYIMIALCLLYIVLMIIGYAAQRNGYSGGGGAAF